MLYKKLFGLVLTGVLAGCMNNPVTTSGDDNNSPKFAVSKSLSAVREVVTSSDPRISTQASSNNEFAAKMYAELAKSDKSGCNLFFSPFSIVSALGMADAGAKGTTDQQIRTALQVVLPGDDFHAALNGIDQSIESHAASVENLQINNVNSIWVQKGDGFKLRVGYLDKLAINYDAGVNLLDFSSSPEPSRVIINDWVSEQTKDRIKDLLPSGTITDLTRVVLTNAIYFLADWKIKFDISKTADCVFTRKDGNKVTIPMMMLHETSGLPSKALKLLYGRVDSTRILELPYCGDRLVMDFLLPDSGAFDYFENKLSKQNVDALVKSLDSTLLPPVRIPRFEFTSGSISLKKACMALGMEAPFNSIEADFSAMSDTHLYISDILHKAFIKVDENGTEAAAATAVIIDVSSISAPKVFIADRPFVYLIRDKQTNTILFMGRVLDPSVKG
jgi:serpin B